MLYIISLGLDSKDLSIKAREAGDRCDVLYLENYTSLGPSLEDLSRLFKKEIKIADRQRLEDNSKEFLEYAKEKDVGLLVYGNALNATTHTSLVLEARKLNVDVKIIHGISVFDAVSETGLSLYNFGKIGTIPIDHDKLESAYQVYEDNMKLGLHTLYLLEINFKESLSISNALKHLIKKGLDKDNICVGCARLGTSNKKIIAGTVEEVMNVDFGETPFCLIIPGNLHFHEEEYLNSLTKV